MSRKNNDLRFASLFCGCGGFDLGFLQAGYRCVAAFDNDPAVVAAHRANLGAVAEVCDLSNGEARLGGLKGIDVLLAGPPCQGFSTAGKRALNDPRNRLLIRAGEIALSLKPKAFVVENVTGVVKGDHKRFWTDLHAMLRGGGYRTIDLKCDVSRLGLAQTRTRMVAVAWRGGGDFNPTLPDGQPGTLRDALAGLPRDAPNHDVKELEKGSYLQRIARRIGQGQKLCNVRAGKRSVHTWHIPEVFGEVTEGEKEVLECLLRLRRRMRLRDFGDADPVSARALASEIGGAVKVAVRSLIAKGFVRKIEGCYDLRHTFNGKMRRLTWDGPSYTVDTRFTDPRYFLHPDKNRGFTVREAARIQGFPDTFVFEGSERSQIGMVGNAVPPPLGKALARCMAIAIDRV